MATDIDTAARILLWSAGINLAVLIVWFLAFAFARDLIFRLHSRWFKIDPERFDEIHYLGMAAYKLLILVFNVVPWLAIRLVSQP
ncbi:MAG: hypothetical protein PHU21_07885 [Elusimicrobia bacterium]|nr:hypothetical protein [Elusimicrobiota bacterium]